jgi:hypothetical protein
MEALKDIAQLFADKDEARSYDSQLPVHPLVVLAIHLLVYKTCYNHQ